MRFFDRKNGFTLVEILAVVAVITVLLSMVIGVGKHVKDQGKIKLTQSTIEILVTAVELYYQDNGDTMPLVTMADPFAKVDFQFAIDPSGVTTITVISGTHPDLDDWSSEAMYYFLCKSINSKRIISTINNSLLTGKDAAGGYLAVNITDTVNNIIVPVDMPRFVDAWGNTIRYKYSAGDTFCLISSPGKDKIYGTNDDITNKN